MRLLVVSHPCVVPVNQDFFAQVEGRGWTVSILVPAYLNTEFGPRVPQRWSGFSGRLIARPVLLKSSVPLHVYRARLNAILRDERPDAIYVHHEPYAAATLQVFVANQRGRSVPIGFYSAQNLNKSYPWPFSAFERYVYRRADFAFPVSTAAAGVLRAKGYRGPIDVLPLAVNTTLFSPYAQAPARTAPLVVGYAGRLTGEKGLSTLFRALASLPAGRVRGVVVGDGPGAVSLRGEASRLGLDDRLEWAGYVPHAQMADSYRRMDVLVVTSRTGARWKEQFGRVVVEALACGVPVIASDSGELPRLMAVTGGGWTYPEGDHAALARLLDELADRPDDRRARAAQGLTMVRRDFDAATVANRFIEAIAARCSMGAVA